MEGGGSVTSQWLWDLYVAGMCAVAVGAVYLLDDRIPGRSPTGATVALTATALWLTIAGRHIPRMGPLGWLQVGYIAVGVALWAVAMWCAPAAVAAVPAMFPIVFSTLPLPSGIVASILVVLLPLGLELAISGTSAPYFPVAVAMALIGLVAAPIIGVVIVTTVRQRIALAELVAELKESRAESARLSREAGVAAERERLAREIHDTLAQGFTSIVALTQAVEAEIDTDRATAARHLQLIETTARENLAEARAMVTQLTPTALDGATLPAAIRRLCAAFEDETEIVVDTDIAEDTPSAGMARDVVLLRVAQEALANVRRHAQATRVHVELLADSGRTRLSLSDNGIGLGTDHTDGFGLRGIRTRVAQAGGAVSIGAGPAGGTMLRAEVQG